MGIRQMERRATDVQRQFDGGTLVLPETCPAVLVRHVRDGVPYAALAAEGQLAEETTRRLAARAAAALRHPDLADLPPGTRVWCENSIRCLTWRGAPRHILITHCSYTGLARTPPG
jgi:hypothetical protein